MKLIAVDPESYSRPPTVNKNFSLGEEYVRQATWQDEDTRTLVTVEVIAYVSGIRARRHSDGSVELMSQVSRFDIPGRDDFMQPIERAVFLWRRTRWGADGELKMDDDIDYSNEIGVVYQDTLEAALANAKLWLDDLDFEVQFDPEAWPVPVDG